MTERQPPSAPMMLMQSPPGAQVVLNGRPTLYFAGTAYFALQGNAQVLRAAIDAIQQYGLHPATSRSGFGETPLLLGLETQAAHYFGTEAALYVAAGYAGPSVLIQAAQQSYDLVVMDEQAHLASQDAAALSAAPIAHFRHIDAQHLRQVLRTHPNAKRVAVMCDGVSPVLGDVAPLSDYLDVCDEHGNATLIVDDAHGVGVLGTHGRGTLEHAEQCSGRAITVNAGEAARGGRHALMCATLSKALGGGGGIVPGQHVFINRLKAESRWYHGAAAPSSPVAAASAQALSILMANPSMRTALRTNIAHMRQSLRGLGLDVADWPTPIVCCKIGDGANMARIQRDLLARGIAVAHSRNYPGVGEDGALRIAVSSAHTAEMINALIDNLSDLL